MSPRVKSEELRPSAIKVIRALMGARLGWGEILRETKISKGMLSRNLKPLIEQGVVLTEVDASTRPARTIYSLNPESVCPICKRCKNWKGCSSDKVFSGFEGLIEPGRRLANKCPKDILGT